MTLKEQIDKDLKTALLGGNKTTVDTLRGLKSVILYDELAKGQRTEGISENEIISLLQKEAKKRQESADLYKSGGNEERAKQELSEKSIIENYLPKSLSEEEIRSLVDSILGEVDEPNMGKMGQIIALAKERSGGSADGATLAGIVKDRLSQ
jgi:uncharacterized protein YqeY